MADVITYFLAPNPRFQGRDATGQPAQYGKLWTYKAGTEIPYETYSDPEGQNENTNPVELDEKGEANIYWQDNQTNPQLYRIILRDADGNLIYDEDNFPTLQNTNSPTPENQNAIDNFIRNPQFTFWSNGTNFPGYTSTTGNLSDYIFDDWYFFRNNTTATVNISRQTFDLGQTLVPGNPVYYVHYESTGGSGETVKTFEQQYRSVQTLSGKTVSFAFWAKSATSSEVEVSIAQDFGNGGSPSSSVETSVLTVTLSPVWERFTGSVTLPSVAGKTLGTAGDDSLVLQFNVPLNSFADSIDFCNFQLQELSSSTEEFPYLTQDEQYKRLNFVVDNGVFKTGDFKTTLRSTADQGWIVCDDGTLGNTASGSTHPFIGTKALYKLIWNTFSNSYAPIFASNGTITTRGSTAEDDFNANKRLSLTKTVGRILATAGQAQLREDFTVSGDILTISDASSFYTGTPVQVSTTGTLPSPLAPSTTYYAIYISATQIKLATTLANAIAGTNITLLSSGTGTNTVFIIYANWTPGQFIGESVHALTIAETPSHNHPGSHVHEDNGSGAVPQLFTVDTGEEGPEIPLTITPQGGSQTHNNMPPTTFVYTHIRL